MAASPIISDRNSIFSDNTEILYPTIGSGYDLDPVLAAAGLDTLFLTMVDNHGLVEYFEIPNSKRWPRLHAAKELRENTRIYKSDHGELKIMVWDENRDTAANIANAILDYLRITMFKLHQSNNQLVLAKLENEYHTLTSQPEDNKEPTAAEASQLERLSRLISEYRVITNAGYEPLLIAEAARPALKHDKPKRIIIIAATGLLAFLFAILALLVVERRKQDDNE
jgi:hypothetical protein